MNDSENNLSERLVNSNRTGNAEHNLQYNFSLQSSTDQITSTIQLFDRLLEDARCCSSQVRSELATALSEALANAIIHGNKRQANKSVAVKILITSEHIQLTVKDQGDGFDFKELPNPLNPNNLKKTNGRGVYLMSLLMDKVKFTRTKDGMEVVLIKLLKNRN